MVRILWFTVSLALSEIAILERARDRRITRRTWLWNAQIGAVVSGRYVMCSVCMAPRQSGPKCMQCSCAPTTFGVLRLRAIRRSVPLARIPALSPYLVEDVFFLHGWVDRANQFHCTRGSRKVSAGQSRVVADRYRRSEPHGGCAGCPCRGFSRRDTDSTRP